MRDSFQLKKITGDRMDNVTQFNDFVEIKALPSHRVRNLKFTTYLKFATRANTNKINELR